MTPTPIFKQLNHMQNIDQYGADKPKQRHGKAWHSKEDKERESVSHVFLRTAQAAGEIVRLSSERKARRERQKEMNPKLKYIINEIKTIAIFALIPSMYIFFGSAVWWWYEPYGTGMLMFAVPFVVFALIGLMASLYDDFCIKIERRHK